MNPLLNCDGYKFTHVHQYPENTTFVYENMTARKSRMEGVSEIVVFGIQSFLRELHDTFARDFFSKPLQPLLDEYIECAKNYCGGLPSYDHIAELHGLGYLPLKFKALPEGTLCPIGVPFLTLCNTHPSAYWLPGWLETWMSTQVWGPITSATIARQYRKLLKGWSDRTCDDDSHLDYQAHDFSFRGMRSKEAAILSAAGHLTSFRGTDTFPAIPWLASNYGANPATCGHSVPATEHSVMCAGGNGDELGTISRLLDIYPKGILSIVSDTWDLWKVLDVYLPQLKDKINARDGKLVIRPDSGDPANIVCGMYTTRGVKGASCSSRGVVETLADHFGYETNSKGFDVLNPKVGVIYGDSITLDRAENICSRLEQKKLASSNCVFGVGSYTYQYNTRDTFGFAIKATGCVVDGKWRSIFKDPVTDDGTKKSAKGWLSVVKSNGQLILLNDTTQELEKCGELLDVYENGHSRNYQTLDEIRNRLGWC